ncbi:hypothetical protein P153DRAFT_178996 [Dothidotthia symphoricarpi CBS 119687]|uniref:Uncharacterized protein n=1 Tax=Dothidotthia symphoricarpi CBS 119687 TaxID=1392245 RepID=A0A6A6ANF6_9PLEO|nr:uncharacterized protein P153DRAFT_178996 [Dothidotthia symphoricarpi CBS 119687]KAF2133066.1 hypothetical protein P153DRAFT_178996 [Dothidotthia symphoricarpi CBS 119687]
MRSMVCIRWSFARLVCVHIGSAMRLRLRLSGGMEWDGMGLDWARLWRLGLGLSRSGLSFWGCIVHIYYDVYVGMFVCMYVGTALQSNAVDRIGSR